MKATNRSELGDDLSMAYQLRDVVASNETRIWRQ